MESQLAGSWGYPSELPSLEEPSVPRWAPSMVWRWVKPLDEQKAPQSVSSMVLR